MTSPENPHHSLDDVLALSPVRQHIQHMYEVGTVGLHESAFAVYEPAAAVPYLETSHLVMPDSISTDFMAGYEDSTRINSQELFAKQPDEDGSDDSDKSFFSFEKYDGIYDYSWLDTSNRQRVERILQSPNASYEERVQTANSFIEARYLNKNNQQRMRSDVTLLVHNHPQYSFRVDPVNKLLTPSAADVTLHTTRAQQQKRHFTSGIVGSDGEQHGILLYRNAPNGAPDAHGFEIRSDGLINPRRILGALAMSGYSYVLLTLDDAGAVSQNSREDLKAFEELFR